MIHIRPVSDLRNKFSEIEKIVSQGQPVFLTKNGYGNMVVISMGLYSKFNEGYDEYIALSLKETEKTTNDDPASLTSDECFKELLKAIGNTRPQRNSHSSWDPDFDEAEGVQIRPVSDLRNKFPEIEAHTNKGHTVFLTKSGHGYIVAMSIEDYSIMCHYKRIVDAKLAAAHSEKTPQ